MPADFFANNRLTKMFGVEVPIIQGGMVHKIGRASCRERV